MHGLADFIFKWNARKYQQTLLVLLAVGTTCYFIHSWPQWLSDVKQKLPRDISIKWFFSFPTLDEVLSPSKVAFYVNQGVVENNAGHIIQAISDYSKAIDLDPNYAQTAYTNRGYAYDQRGDYALAMSDLDKAIGIDPLDAQAYVNRGNVYFHQKNYVRAVSDYNRALGINPQFGLAYNNRALSFYFLKEYGKAWADAQQAEKLGIVVNLDFLSILRKEISI